MLSLEKIPDVIGYLVLNEEGAVLSSGGELENDEKSANIITGLIQMTDNVDSKYFANNSCQRICIAYEEHNYVICMSNKKVYVVKKKNPIQLHSNSSGGGSGGTGQDSDKNELNVMA